MAPIGTRKSIRAKKICFYSNLGKVFQSPEFQEKLFLSEIEWVIVRETASFKILLSIVSIYI